MRIAIVGLLFASFVGPALADGHPTSPGEIHPLLIGAQAPEATLHSADGTAVGLSDLLSEKPTILIFYRGGW